MNTAENLRPTFADTVEWVFIGFHYGLQCGIVWCPDVASCQLNLSLSVLFRVNWMLSGPCFAAGTTRSPWWDPSPGIMWVPQQCTMEIFHFIKYFYPLTFTSPVPLFPTVFCPHFFPLVVFYSCGDPQLYHPLFFSSFFHSSFSCFSSISLLKFLFLRFCFVHSPGTFDSK